MAGDKEQTFDFETMAVVLYAMLQTGAGLGSEHYRLMSAADGKRTESSFQHQFRDVKRRARELKEQAEAGNTVTPVTPAKKRGGKAGGTPAGSKSTGKRGRKSKAEMREADAADEDDDLDSPSKKVKHEAVEEEDTGDYM